MRQRAGKMARSCRQLLLSGSCDFRQQLLSSLSGAFTARRLVGRWSRLAGRQHLMLTLLRFVAVLLVQCWVFGCLGRTPQPSSACQSLPRVSLFSKSAGPSYIL